MLQVSKTYVTPSVTRDTHRHVTPSVTVGVTLHRIGSYICSYLILYLTYVMRACANHLCMHRRFSYAREAVTMHA